MTLRYMPRIIGCKRIVGHRYMLEEGRVGGVKWSPCMEYKKEVNVKIAKGIGNQNSNLEPVE